MSCTNDQIVGQVREGNRSSKIAEAKTGETQPGKGKTAEKICAGEEKLEQLEEPKSGGEEKRREEKRREEKRTEENRAEELEEPNRGEKKRKEKKRTQRADRRLIHERRRPGNAKVVPKLEEPRRRGEKTSSSKSRAVQRRRSKSRTEEKIGEPRNTYLQGN
jgi:hypothetical protein